MQVVVRIPDELVKAVDRLVESGKVESRSDAVRSALAEYVDRLRRDLVGEAIVAGYAKSPQAAADSMWLESDSDKMIAEESW